MKTKKTVSKESADILKKLYNTEFNFKTADKKQIRDVNGSLGVLALGYRGLIAWRKAKKQIISS